MVALGRRTTLFALALGNLDDSAKRLSHLRFGVLLICPCLRLLGWQHHVPVLYHRFEMIADTLAMGCLLALHQERAEKWLRCCWISSTGAVVGYFGVFVLCCYENKLHSGFQPIAVTIEATCGRLIISSTVFSPQTLISRFLRWRPLTSLGRISYSLYIWQQLFLLPDLPSRHAPTGIFAFPQNVCALLGVAVASYYGVELPVRKYSRRHLLRHRRRTEPSPLNRTDAITLNSSPALRFDHASSRPESALRFP